eukprot:scaffold4081_cov119-Isochrysis_galbana.AAC.3
MLLVSLISHALCVPAIQEERYRSIRLGRWWLNALKPTASRGSVPGGSCEAGGAEKRASRKRACSWLRLVVVQLAGDRLPPTDWELNASPAQRTRWCALSRETRSVEPERARVKMTNGTGTDGPASCDEDGTDSARRKLRSVRKGMASGYIISSAHLKAGFCAGPIYL